MLTYRATLQPRSATLSPWQADTLFGHLCWLLLYQEGEAALNDFLDRYRQRDPPLLFSNGFPGDRLPRPLVPARRTVTERTKGAQIHAMREAKAGKGVRWVNLDEFNVFRRGEHVVLGPRPPLVDHRTVLKNQINRITFGTTPVEEEIGGGNLYNADELAFVDTSGLKRVGLNVSLYVMAQDEEWADKAEDMLEWLSQGGYGAKKAVGYGHFELARWEPFSGFDVSPPEANGFISLSNWVPASGDPTDGFYTTMVKYGKLGEELAHSENPFKFPLIMLTAGSSFYADAPIREWYGRLVEKVAPSDERVVQYAYAFAVPARLATETF
jgi:CRISPR-associated protein Csm4